MIMKKIFAVFLVIFCCAASSFCKNVNNIEVKTNSVIDNMLNRKSVRKYSDKKVEQDKIDIILKCAMAAPSAMNKQPWELLVVTDKEILEKLASIAPNASYSRNCQLAIIVCGNKSVSEKFWIQDCCAVTENILLAVESLNLGAVWCAVFPDDVKVQQIQELFSISEDIIPLNIVPIGYPLVKEYPKQKYTDKKVHLNKWEK